MALTQLVADRLKWLGTRGHSWLYRTSNGRLGGSIRGTPILLLTTTGRRSGKQRVTPLIYLRDGDDLVVIASNGGSPRPPAWWLNLQARPESTVELGRARLPVRAEEADAETAARLWPAFVAAFPGYEGYRTRTNRPFPIVLLRPVTPSGAPA